MGQRRDLHSYCGSNPRYFRDDTQQGLRQCDRASRELSQRGNLRPRHHADTNTNRDGDADRNADSNRDRYTNCYGDSDSDADAHGNVDRANANRDCDLYAIPAGWLDVQIV